MNFFFLSFLFFTFPYLVYRWHWWLSRPSAMLLWKVNNVWTEWEEYNEIEVECRCVWVWKNGIWSVHNEVYELNCLHYESSFDESYKRIDNILILLLVKTEKLWKTLRPLYHLDIHNARTIDIVFWNIEKFVCFSKFPRYVLNISCFLDISQMFFQIVKEMNTMAFEFRNF